MLNNVRILGEATADVHRHAIRALLHLASHRDVPTRIKLKPVVPVYSLRSLKRFGFMLIESYRGSAGPSRGKPCRAIPRKLSLAFIDVELNLSTSLTTIAALGAEWMPLSMWLYHEPVHDIKSFERRKHRNVILVGAVSVL